MSKALVIYSTYLKYRAAEAALLEGLLAGLLVHKRVKVKAKCFIQLAGF
jgi:hypothetical protein